MGYLGQAIWSGPTSDIGLFTLLGMAAMMGAVLSAPLSALITVLELTNAPGMMLPSMMTVMVAFLTCRILFKQRTIFESAIGSNEFSSQRDNLDTLLQRVGVTSLMSDSFQRCSRYIAEEQATQLLSKQPQWIILQSDEDQIVLRAADLAHFLSETVSVADRTAHPTSDDDSTIDTDNMPNEIDLLSIPGVRYETAALDMRASLSEALTKLDQSGFDTLLVHHTSAPMITPIVGILTRNDIENYYHVPH